MLKSMRKNLKSLAPTLWFVIIAFIISIFAVWGGAGRLGESRGGNTIAKVGSEKITAEEYIENLRVRLQSMQEEFKELNAEFIQQLNIPQQVQEQLIQKAVLLQIAERMGLRATDEEIKNRILNLPVFQREGEFVGYEEYEKILEWNRIPVSQFEEGLRDDVLVQKTVDLITAGITATREELWDFYKDNNESAKIEYLVINAADWELETEPSEAELRDYYSEHKNQYNLPPQREGDFVYLSYEEFKETLEIEKSSINEYYENNKDRFTEPAEISVSRIFISTEEEEAPQEKITEIHEKLKSGADFGELAAQYSDDEKAEEQGDWGRMEWKRLSPEEQEVIQSLEENAFSEPVELENGYSLLKVTEKIPEKQLSLDEVRDRIIRILKDQKSRESAQETMAAVQQAAKKEKSLDVAAQKLGYKIKSSGLIEEGAGIDEVDPTGNISRALFMLEEVKDISSVVQTMEGMAVVQLNRIEPARPAKYEEVQEEVREDWLNHEKKQQALEQALSLKKEYEGKELEPAAQKYDLEFKTVEEHKRNQYLSIVGDDPEIDRAAFSLPLDELSQPLEYKDGYILLRVLDRVEVTQEEFKENIKEVRDNLINTKTNKFFQSYYIRQREQMGVKPNYKLINRINSEILARYRTEK